MASLDMNFSSAVVLVIIAALAVLAVRRIVRRGMCDSGGSCDSCASGGGCSSCSSCSAVDKMVADMEHAARKKR